MTGQNLGANTAVCWSPQLGIFCEVGNSGTVATTAIPITPQSTTQIGQIAKDTLNANSMLANPKTGMRAHYAGTDSLDWEYPEREHELDSTLVALNYLSVIDGYVQKAITVDSVYGLGGGTAANVVVTILTDDTLYAADAITVATCTVNSVTVGSWTSASGTHIPAGNKIWAKITTMTTAPNKLYLKLRFRYGTL